MKNSDTLKEKKWGRANEYCDQQFKKCFLVTNSFE